jgi:hypothetical protein
MASVPDYDSLETIKEAIKDATRAPIRNPAKTCRPDTKTHENAVKNPINKPTSITLTTFDFIFD